MTGNCAVSDDFLLSFHLLSVSIASQLIVIDEATSSEIEAFACARPVLSKPSEWQRRLSGVVATSAFLKPTATLR